jgi:sulfur-carrier protein adenylyltransferase/sulfurtransferase
MPDSDPAMADRHRSAIAELGTFIESLDSGRELRPNEVRAYVGRSFSQGWSLNIEFSDCPRQVHVLVDANFPFDPPRIVLVDRPEFLTWPHVEADGVLCLLDANATISPQAPVIVLKHLLAHAVHLVQDSIEGRNLVDFEAEFHTYWNYRLTERSKICNTLLDLRNQRSRIVQFWRGTVHDFVADDPEAIRTWLQHRYGKPYEGFETSKALLVWLARPLRPQEYPSTPRTLLPSIEGGGALSLLPLAISRDSDHVLIFLGANTENGPVIAGIVAPTPNATDVAGRKREMLHRGFRPGRVPPNILARRYLQSDRPVTRFKCERIDHEWIHGRANDPNQSVLKRCHIIVLGCGAVGSEAAAHLSRAGIGKVTTVDNDRLEWSNISRHRLGATSVGKDKSAELVASAQPDLPHLSIEHRVRTVQQLIETEPSVLSGCDIVVDLTANWGAQTLLNYWHRSRDWKPVIVYGWTEPRAAAGHAVRVGGRGSCLQCGFDDTGLQRFTVTSWLSALDLHEPGCGAVFQPFGFTQVAATVRLVSQLVLDCLLGKVAAPTHRFWVSRKTDVYSEGGTWTAEWQAHSEFRDLGDIGVEQAWPGSHVCSECQ